MIFIVIYVDVLLCINFFITFLILELTAKLAKKQTSLFRLIIGSCIGALYSLIIFADKIPIILTELSKLVSVLIIIAAAFHFYRLTQYIKTVLIYYFSSVIFLGITMLLCFTLKLKFIAVNNSVVYFNLSAPMLILSGILAYAVSGVVINIYTLIIEQDGKSYSFCAFLDTGNRLREPFSNMPIIIVDSSKIDFIPKPEKSRFVPVTTVNGRSVLTAFKPDKIVLKSSNSDEIIENAYVALSSDLCNKKFSAILNYDILSI